MPRLPPKEMMTSDDDNSAVDNADDFADLDAHRIGMAGSDTQPAHENIAAGKDTQHVAAQGTVAANGGKQTQDSLTARILENEILAEGSNQWGTTPDTTVGETPNTMLMQTDR